jgi:sialate O-acetylesterase
MKLSLIAFCISLTLGATLSAAVRLPQLISDHAVLQRDKPVTIWGWADPKEAVKVEFNGQSVATTAEADGAWRVELKPMAAAAGSELVVTGANTLRVADVAVGEVWICSGQSNMQWTLSNTRDGDLDALAASDHDLRVIRIDDIGTQTPNADVDADWQPSDPDAARSFTAVGYYFGKQLRDTLNVPVGLIDNSWGGSACEAWVPNGDLADNSLYEAMIERWKAEVAKADEPTLRKEYDAKFAAWRADLAKAKAAGEKWPGRPWNEHPLFGNQRPANLYQARVAPLLNYGIRGAIWYQGESNAGRAFQYRDLFPRMISAWRRDFKQGDFPFYWVQLADFKPEAAAPGDSDWAELREAQTMTLDKLPNVGQAVIIDIGEGHDIHPHNKLDVGRRLARLALAQTYGRDKLPASSPRFDKAEFNDGKAVLSFKNVSGKLTTDDGVAPTGFVISGEERTWRPATAKLLEDGRIEVSAPDVPQPVAVRYGWADNPVVNVRTGNFLPLTPFRTDDWPGVTDAAR